MKIGSYKYQLIYLNASNCDKEVVNRRRNKSEGIKMHLFWEVTADFSEKPYQVE